MTNFLTTLRTLDAAARSEKGAMLVGPYRLHPMQAQTILKAFLVDHAAAIIGCVEALERLRDCDWVITPADRMDAVRTIARDALAALEEE